jgi:hypothetical protein
LGKSHENRAEKYQKKMKIRGTFADVIKVRANPDKPKEKAVKKKK